MKRVFIMLLALCMAVSVSIVPSAASAAGYVSSSNYTIEKVDRSFYDSTGSLKLSQYFDKVVLTDSSDNANKINELITRRSGVQIPPPQPHERPVAITVTGFLLFL